MMIGPGYIARHRHQLLEAQMVPRFWRDPESIPRSAPITPNHASADLCLERCKSIAHDAQKPGPRHCVELLLGIVEIVDVDDGEPEILSAALNLIVEVARRETVATGNDVSGLHHPGPVVLAVEKAPIAFLGGGRSSVERDISAL